jgi:hypothetical protein
MSNLTTPRFPWDLGRESALEFADKCEYLTVVIVYSGSLRQLVTTVIFKIRGANCSTADIQYYNPVAMLQSGSVASNNVQLPQLLRAGVTNEHLSSMLVQFDPLIDQIVYCFPSCYPTENFEDDCDSGSGGDDAPDIRDLADTWCGQVVEQLKHYPAVISVYDERTGSDNGEQLVFKFKECGVQSPVSYLQPHFTSDWYPSSFSDSHFILPTYSSPNCRVGLLRPIRAYEYYLVK